MSLFLKMLNCAFNRLLLHALHDHIREGGPVSTWVQPLSWLFNEHEHAVRREYSSVEKTPLPWNWLRLIFLAVSTSDTSWRSFLLKQNMVITRVSREINIKAVHVFSFGLLFSPKPLCGSGNSFAGPLNQLTAFLSWYDAGARGPLLWALTDWVKRSSVN